MRHTTADGGTRGDCRPQCHLRKVLRPGGEMMLVADRTQDIYGVSRYSTDEKMVGSGLKGRGAVPVELPATKSDGRAGGALRRGLSAA